MYYANDANGNRVRINNANPDEQYFCPTCNQKLIQRRSGSFVLPHFAHYPSNRADSEYTPCVDRWVYDDSEWAREWQDRFPVEYQEKVVGNIKEKHRADVCAENVVIEFQKGSISLERFEKRNKFFAELGYIVIWIFDLREEFGSGKIVHSDDCAEAGRELFRWERPKKFFEDIRLTDTDAEIYVQFKDPEYNVNGLYHVVEQRFKFREIYTDRAYPIGWFAKSVFHIYEKSKGRTIYQLWNSEFRAMAVSCVSSGKDILINGVDGAMEKDDKGRIVGKIRERGEDGKYHSLGNGAKYVIYGLGEPKWILKRFWEREE